MKIKKTYLIFVAVATLLGLVASLLYVNQLGPAQDKAVAFISVASDVSTLPAEVSSYEILRANEHFSDIVLGWTVEPSFTAEFEELTGVEFSFSGQRQEKQNLIFEISGANDLTPAYSLVDLIEMCLLEYNASTNSNYLVALQRYSFVEGERSDGRIVLGATILVLALSVSSVMLWDYATRR